MTTVTTTQKPKLTGWAQAAARSAPKQQLNLKSSNKELEKPAEVVVVQQAPASQRSNSSERKKLGNSNNSQKHKKNTSNHNNITRHPYNRDEVRKFMNDLFKSYTANPELKSYKDIVGNTNAVTATNWGTVSNNKNKNKKYGCLNDVAKLLKN